MLFQESPSCRGYITRDEKAIRQKRFMESRYCYCKHASFLVHMAGVSVSAVGSHERAAGLAGPVKVQAISPEDATVTALNKEGHKGEVAEQQHTLEIGIELTQRESY